TVAHDEEVGRVAAPHEAEGIEHQGLVRPRRDSLQQRLDQVEPAVGVETQIEDVGAAAAEGGGCELQPLALQCRIRNLVLGRDCDGGASQRIPRVLMHRALLAARYHQAQMRPIVYAVGGNRLEQRGLEPRLVHPDIERDGARAFDQALQVLVDENQSPVCEPDALPHTVAEAEAGIEDRYKSLAAPHEPPVEPAEHGVVAGIFCRCLRTLRLDHDAVLSRYAISMIRFMYLSIEKRASGPMTVVDSRSSTTAGPR